MFDRIIDEIQKAKKPEIIEVDGHQYTSEPVVLAPAPIRLAKALVVRTLSALAEYVNDNLEIDKAMIVVEGPSRVVVYGKLDAYRQREALLVAEAITGSQHFGQWVGLETFLIALQTQFEETPDLLAVLKVCGNLADETSINYQDDGVTQKVIAKTGIARVDTAVLPRIVTLRPFRTFTDVAQVDEKFLLRLRKGVAPEASLFEADGNLWAKDAIANIKAFLGEHVSSFSPVEIIG